MDTNAAERSLDLGLLAVGGGLAWALDRPSVLIGTGAALIAYPFFGVLRDWRRERKAGWLP